MLNFKVIFIIVLVGIFLSISAGTSFKHISAFGFSIPNPNNVDSALPTLYNSTAKSVVEITVSDNTNHSVSKTGSGFIYNSNESSSIVTSSNLVVGGNNSIVVTLSDGSSFYTRIIGYDPITGIAVPVH